MSKYGLHPGRLDLRSVGAITFGPEGILFVADNVRATVSAIDVPDVAEGDAAAPITVDHLDARLAAFLGCERRDVVIRDMAVHPISGAVYLSVMRGHGESATPLILRLDGDGSLREVSLEAVDFDELALDDAPKADDERVVVRLDGEEGMDCEEIEVRGVHLRLYKDRLRSATITDLAWIDGMLLVAGVSNEEFSSTLRRVAFPFDGDASSNSLEIYHVSHGKYETASPIRTFVPYDGNTSVLASYTCTPVVRFSLRDFQPGAQVAGRTVAELGSMNQPLDMVSYRRDGEEFLLVSNTRHPLLKMACRDIDAQGPLTQHLEPVGVPREELAHEGVIHMANLDDSHVLMLQREESGALHVRSYSTASL
jgi:hypothetical protein